MPGKRYSFRITTGPFTGTRCRILRQLPDPRYIEVERPGNLPTVVLELQHLERIPQKSTRRKP
jgi:hypothetical protein